MLNLATKLLHLFPPEMAHDLAIMGLRMTNGIQPPMVDELLQQTVMGKVFSHPVGLAAGFDKDARVFQKIGQLGFSFVEVGSVTPKPQPGNSKPRLFRLADHQAIINSYGFNSRGMDYVAERFINNPTKIITGINLGKNKDSIDYIQDFSAVAEKLLPYADYLTVNVSSPNTLGLRDLQTPGQLEPLIKQLLYLIKSGKPSCPLLIKLAPDMPLKQESELIEFLSYSGISGMIISNTTVARDIIAGHRYADLGGGLSGPPLREMACAMLKRTYRQTQGRVALIATGGICSGADVYHRMCLGANLVQIFTGFIYEGPGVLHKILAELMLEMKKNCVSNLSDIIGTGNKE